MTRGEWELRRTQLRHFLRIHPGVALGILLKYVLEESSALLLKEFLRVFRGQACVEHVLDGLLDTGQTQKLQALLLWQPLMKQRSIDQNAPAEKAKF